MSTFRHSRLTACLAFVVFALCASSARAGDNCIAPPGTSGIDQYCEALPNAGGTGGGGGHHGDKSHPLTASTTKALEHQGAAGAAVLALARSVPTAPAPAYDPAGKVKGKHRHKRRSSGGSSQEPSNGGRPLDTGNRLSAPASNPAAAVGKSLTGSALGGGFLAILAAIAVVLAALGWLGRRRGPGSEAA